MSAGTIELTGEYLAAAKELRGIAAVRKTLAEREATCKAILGTIFTIGDRGVSPDGEEMCAMRKGAARFKPELAEVNLEAAALALIMVTAPDAKRAKALLSPVLYDLCTEENNPSVVAL